MTSRRCGPATLLERLGEGGSGDIWLARHDDGRSVVVKQFVPSIALDIDDVLATATRLRGKRLPNVVGVIECGVADEQAWVCLEHVDGVDVRSLLHRGPPGTSVALAVANGVLVALAALHDAGQVHRDLSSSNVMIGRDGRVVVIDLDFACPMGTAATETVPGTPAYMSPEQAQGLPVDARADHYAWAIVVCELLLGERFYADLDDDAVLRLARTGGYRPASFANLPAGVRAVLVQALSPDASARLTTTAQLQQAWKQATVALPLATSATLATLAGSTTTALHADVALQADWQASPDDAPIEASSSVFRPRSDQGRKSAAVVVVVLVLLAVVLLLRAR
jgi:serine/threonine protein kinase